jgi:hypothetical protein
MTAKELCDQLRALGLNATDPIEQDPRYGDSRAVVLLSRGVYVQISGKFLHLERFNGQSIRSIKFAAKSVDELVAAYKEFRSNILNEKV